MSAQRKRKKGAAEDNSAWERPAAVADAVVAGAAAAAAGTYDSEDEEFIARPYAAAVAAAAAAAGDSGMYAAADTTIPDELTFGSEKRTLIQEVYSNVHPRHRADLSITAACAQAADVAWRLGTPTATVRFNALVKMLFGRITAASIRRISLHTFTALKELLIRADDDAKSMQHRLDGLSVASGSAAAAAAAVVDEDLDAFVQNTVRDLKYLSALQQEPAFGAHDRTRWYYFATYLWVHFPRHFGTLRGKTIIPPGYSNAQRQRAEKKRQTHPQSHIWMDRADGNGNYDLDEIMIPSYLQVEAALRLEEPPAGRGRGSDEDTLHNLSMEFVGSWTEYADDPFTSSRQNRAAAAAATNTVSGEIAKERWQYILERASASQLAKLANTTRDLDAQSDLHRLDNPNPAPEQWLSAAIRQLHVRQTEDLTAARQALILHGNARHDNVRLDGQSVGTQQLLASFLGEAEMAKRAMRSNPLALPGTARRRAQAEME